MIYLIVFFTLLPNLALAGNINIPTVVLTERLMLYSFALIVVLEAFVFRRFLPDLSKKNALLISLKANLITIFVAVPIVWGVWLAVMVNLPDFITNILNELLNAASKAFGWNNEVITNIIWAPLILEDQSLLVAECVMGPVYFIASYYLEYWFSRKKLMDYDKSKVKRAFFFSNLCSYVMIMIFETIYQIYHSELSLMLF